MIMMLHQTNDLAELDEVLMLPRHQRVALEEGGDHQLQILPSGDRIGRHGAVGALCCDASTGEEPSQRLQDPDVVTMLVGLEPGSD